MMTIEEKISHIKSKCICLTTNAKRKGIYLNNHISRVPRVSASDRYKVDFEYGICPLFLFLENRIAVCINMHKDLQRFLLLEYKEYQSLYYGYSKNSFHYSAEYDGDVWGFYKLGSDLNYECSRIIKG